MGDIFSAEQIWADIEYRGKSVSKEFVKLTDYKELEADRLTMCESAEKLIKANVMLKALMEDDKNKNKELEAVTEKLSALCLQAFDQGKDQPVAFSENGFSALRKVLEHRIKAVKKGLL